MTFFDYWKTLNECFDNNDLSAQTQLVGYKLLAVFNERKFPESTALSDRELQSLTNIKSLQTIVDARRQLKNAGLIDFKTAKNKPTEYHFVTPRTSTNQALCEQDSSTGQAQGLVSYTRVREDVKTKDVRQKHDDEEARARGEGETVTAKDNTRANPLSSPIFDPNAIQDLWEFETGYQLTGSTALELETLATENFELVKRAIIASVKSKATDRLRYSYFRKIYDAMKTPKGGEEHGGYIKPAEDDEAEWRGYV